MKTNVNAPSELKVKRNGRIVFIVNELAAQMSERAGAQLARYSTRRLYARRKMSHSVE